MKYGGERNAYENVYVSTRQGKKVFEKLSHNDFHEKSKTFPPFTLACHQRFDT